MTMGAAANRRPSVLPVFSSSDHATGYQWSGCAPIRRKSNTPGGIAARMLIKFDPSSGTDAPNGGSGCKISASGGPKATEAGARPDDAAPPARVRQVTAHPVLYAAPAGTQTTVSSSSAAPLDAEIRRILAERIDVQKQGVGIVVGVIDSRGRRVVAYGAPEKGDKRPVDGDTLFEIG